MATKVIPIKRITAWSFSRYSTYEQCPLKLKLTAIDRLKEPPNAAMARGADIHKQAEGYIKGTLTTLPVELTLFKSEFQALRKLYKRSAEEMRVEDNWAFTKDWTETAWDDWTGCWVRIKLDCAHHIEDDVMVISDWKTGKYRADLHADYLEQLELYALAALLLHPYLREVRPRLVYTDQGTIYPPAKAPLVYTPADVPRLKKLWAKRVEPMLNDTIFAPRPNRWCGNCHFRKNNGGPCAF